MSGVSEQRGAAPVVRFGSHFVFLPNGCWQWALAPNPSGYGTFWIAGKTVLAHRFAYELLVGLIPDGQELDHLCHTNDRECAGGTSCRHRLCVNPAHLEPVTHLENVLRGQSVMAERAAQTHCKHGHELTAENVYERPGHRRECRACWPRRRAERAARIASAA